MSPITISRVSRMIRRIILGSCVLLSGCIVLPATYYEPLTDGETRPAGCGGGPADLLTAPIADGVSVTLSVSSSQPAWVITRFNVPANNTLRLIHPGVKLLDGQGTVIHEFSIPYLTDHISDQYGHRQLRRRPGDLLQGGTDIVDLPFGSREVHRSYSAEQESVGSLPDYIQIQLPELEVNGKRITPDPIQFEKATGIFLYSLNC